MAQTVAPEPDTPAEQAAELKKEIDQNVRHPC